MHAPSERTPAAPALAEADEALPRRFGKYTLLRKMATGGMAEIYLALQRSVAGFEKLIVIKRILPAMNRDRGFIDMLLHEARVAATLSHPNIVGTIDVGQVDGQYFIALEHVHGEDLRSIVRQMRKKNVTQFPVEHAIAIILAMCAGLSYAHEKRDLDGTELNIVHRDVSPQNVIVGFAGDTKIVDFGVAKSGTQGGLEQTRGGQLKGKVPYMSPEQARCEEVDWRSDIFAVGVMLFELTTGRRLFKGANEYETLKLIVERDYPHPSWVAAGYPPALEKIVLRALEKDRDKRYQSAREMQSDLEAFVRDEKLPVSSIALAEFMKSLFEEKLAAQKEALMQGRQLADVIATEVNVQSEGTSTTGADSQRPSFSHLSTTTSGAAAIGDITAPRRASRAWLLAIPVGLAALAGTIYLVTRSPHRDDAPSTAAAPSSTAAKKASLNVTSDPSGAHIWVNGEPRSETTPATLEDLPLGAIDVKVTLEGYVAKTDHVTLESGAPMKRNFTLDKQSGKMTVEVTTLPKGATATLDGKSVKLPSFEASAGDKHTLVVSAGGYATKTLQFSGDPDEMKKLDGSLDRPSAGGVSNVGAPPVNNGVKPTSTGATGGSGKISVTSSGGWCNASVDGRGLGPTPTGVIEVGAGPHTVSCVDPNGKSLMQGASVKAGETRIVRFAVAN